MKRFSCLAATLGLLLGTLPLAAQRYSGPRTPDGKPNLNGIWQSMNSGDWDILAHSANMPRVIALGAQDAEPPGPGIVEGNVIPYLPGKEAQKQANYQKRLTDDPTIKCFMPGVPRANYMNFPFQIVQTPDAILVAYEFASASRTMYIKNPPPIAADSWMGHSVAHWEGDTLVVKVDGMVDQTWFDRVGDFHSDAMVVTERYTPMNEYIVNYEATIEDKNTFSRPWKVSFPLYKHIEKNASLMEFKCVEFVEELMYGKYRKKKEE